jgi:hypothetical protein
LTIGREEGHRKELEDEERFVDINYGSQKKRSP